MLYWYHRSITKIVETLASTVLQPLRPGIAMESFRKRKALGSGVHLVHTKSAPVIPDELAAGEGRILRSKSGRKVSEKILADALTQSTSLENRGLEKVPSSRTSLIKGRKKVDDKVKKTARESAARAGARSQDNTATEGIAVLASGPEPLVIAEQNHVPISEAGPSFTIFPVWTEAELKKASQHLCEVDPCKCI